MDDLRKAYPALVDQIEQAAAGQAAKAAAEAAINGARTRIQNMEDMALPGSGALAAQVKFTKPMSAEDFAKQMVKNAKIQGASYLAQVGQDVEKSGVNGVTNTPPNGRTGGGEFLATIKGLGQKQ